ncbi:alpha/beta-hydrolase [Trametopsis cervina]|nr:alpha/beta-hydrolase [Trametopsis cervina]
MSFSNLRKIPIHYDNSQVEAMLTLLKLAPFPERAPIDAATPWSLGIDYDYLKTLKQKFSTEWTWERLERELNKFDHYLVNYVSPKGDELEVHFVHQKSERADAVPLLALHGWPGTFYDFHKVIEPLANPPSADLPAFNVVVPSLPGFFKSTLPRRDGWNLEDIARLFNDLMVNLLGYKTYYGQGGDWGSMTMRVLASEYADSMTAVHFNMFLVPPSANLDVSKYTEREQAIYARLAHFHQTGRAYYDIQNTKPFTIGIAIASSPLAILSWIGEKFYGWSDPERLDPQDIIDTTALYFLSGSFSSSVVIYNQAHKTATGENALIPSMSIKVKSKAFAFSVFPYELGLAAEADVAPFGNLTFYKLHEGGGHFPALDSPAELIADLREFFGKRV